MIFKESLLNKEEGLAIIGVLINNIRYSDNSIHLAENIQAYNQLQHYKYSVETIIKKNLTHSSFQE